MKDETFLHWLVFWVIAKLIVFPAVIVAGLYYVGLVFVESFR